MTDMRCASSDPRRSIASRPAAMDNRSMAEADANRARLAGFPARLAAAARTSPAGTPAPGEWTPPEIVRHLIAVEEEVWHRRLGQLRTEEHPRWRWTEPGQWLGAEGANLDNVRRYTRTFGRRRSRCSTRSAPRAGGERG